MLNCPSFITFNENVCAEEIALNRDEQLREPSVYRQRGEGKVFLLKVLDVFRQASHFKAKFLLLCFLDCNPRAEATLLGYKPSGREG